MLQSRHSDKSVYRHCKERLDRHNQEEKEQADLRKAVRKLLEDARKLSTSVDSPEYKSRYLALKGRWEKLASHCDDEQGKQIADDLEISSLRIEKKDAAEAAEVARKEHTEDAKRTFGELISELGGH